MFNDVRKHSFVLFITLGTHNDIRTPPREEPCVVTCWRIPSLDLNGLSRGDIQESHRFFSSPWWIFWHHYNDCWPDLIHKSYGIIRVSIWSARLGWLAETRDSEDCLPSLRKRHIPDIICSIVHHHIWYQSRQWFCFWYFISRSLSLLHPANTCSLRFHLLGADVCD